MASESNINVSIDSKSDPIGLIGMGLVGSALAQRFLQTGFMVMGFDIDSARCREMKSLGVQIADSPATISRNTRRIVLSLPDSQVVEQVIFGDAGLTQSDLHCAIIIDTTTGNPPAAENNSRRLLSINASYIEACIIGSSRLVSAGEAIVVAGGTPEDIVRCRDIINSFAVRMFHVGAVGKGSQSKLVVNLVIGLHRLVLSEGLVLADALQLDLRSMLELLKSGVSYSRIMDTKGEKMLTRDFTPEARLAQHLKDVNLILQLGKTAGVELPLSQLHKRILDTGVAMGLGDLDNSAVFEVLSHNPKQSS